ncbi:hypothetical protein, partial [Pseudomonas sp. Q11]|uniref:hypothetical protein n=1 Tax=Pseudomonas sp. Q11 TaxID=2968470 RepID=UPI0021087B97
ALTFSLITMQDTSGLAREGGLSETVMLDVLASSRAGSLPQWILRQARLGDQRKDNCGSEPARDSSGMFNPIPTDSPSQN